MKRLTLLKQHIKGYILIAIAASCWGGAATLVKHLLNSKIDPLIIVQTRVSLSFILLFVYFSVVNPSALRFKFRDIPLFLFVGICGVAGSNYFYYFAIQASNVATAILVQYTAPVMVALYATVVQREPLTRSKIVAVILSMVGIFLAVGGYDMHIIHATNRAILFAFIAAIAYSIFNIAGKPLVQKYSVWTSLIFVLGAASLFRLFINTPQKIISAHYRFDQWMIFLLVVVVSILIPYGCYFSGLRYIQPTQAIITSTLEPIVAIVSEFLFLGASLGYVQIGGAMCVLAAIVVLQLQPVKDFNPVAQE